MGIEEEVKESLEGDFTEEEVRDILREKGYSRRQIDELIKDARASTSESILNRQLELYSWLALTVSLSLIYVYMVSAPLNLFYPPSKILPFLAAAGGLAGTVAVFNLGSSIHRFKLDGYSGKVPGISSIIMISALLVFYALLSNLMSSEMFARSFSLSATPILFNAIMLFPAIISAFYLKERIGLKSFFIVVIPLLLVFSSHAIWAMNVDSGAEDYQFQHESLDRIQPMNGISDSRFMPPTKKIQTSLQMLLALKGQLGLGDITFAKFPATEPRNFCTNEVVSTHLAAYNPAEYSKRYLSKVKNNRETVEKNLIRRCERKSECSVDNIDTSKEVSKFIGILEEQNKVIQNLFREPSKGGPSNMCLGEEEKIRITQISCQNPPSVVVKNLDKNTIENQISGTIKGRFNGTIETLYIGDKMLNLESNEEKKLTFNTLRESDIEEGQKYVITLSFSGSQSEYDASAVCKGQGSFCSNCSTLPIER